MRRAASVVATTLLGLAIIMLIRLWSIRDKAPSTRDALTYVILGWDEHTTYAEKFTEGSFRTLRIGMTAGEVRRMVGPPLDSLGSDSGRVVWRYTVGYPKGTYWLRSVVLDSTKRVVQVAAMLYLD